MTDANRRVDWQLFGSCTEHGAGVVPTGGIATEIRDAPLGSGVAGLGAAYALSQHHDVTLYERDHRFGGHANTEVITIEGEDIAQSDPNTHHVEQALTSLDCLIVQDIFMTRTAELADVVLPASVAWAEHDGTVTSSERRVQRVRAAVTPPTCLRR